MYVRTRVGMAGNGTPATGSAAALAGYGYLGQPVVADPVAEIGEQLWRRAPAGVTIAIYDSGDRELTSRAKEWAEREGAIGVKATKIEAAELALGKALADAGGFVKQVTQVGAALQTAVAKADRPKEITPLQGTGPSLIRVLALFTHGTNDWLGIGKGFTTRNAADVIKGIAPFLTVDVRFLIYGCSAALGQKEASNWLVTTMEPGGADSLAGLLRDALVDQGKGGAAVWSHTQVGHTTRNPSLRVFNAGFGKGSAGESYAGTSIFGSIEKVFALGEIEGAIRALGFTIPADKEENLRRLAYPLLRNHMYTAWVRAVVTTTTVRGETRRTTNLTYRGGSLPEMAPLYPLDVADIARRYWSKVYWTEARRKDIARSLAKQLKLTR